MLNKIQLIGRLGKDPELKTFESGDVVANFSLATSEKYKDKSGESKETTEWHRIVLWGRQAEIAGQYLKKGSRIYLEGKLTSRKYKDKNGTEQTIVEIRGSHLVMLDTKSESTTEHKRPSQTTTDQTQTAAATTDDFDDLPF